MLEVSVFFDDDDRIEGKPMHEYIMRYLMHHDIGGATLFAAQGGFGRKRHLQQPRKFGAADEGPMMILFADEEGKVRAVLPHLKEVVKEGLILAKSVERV